MTFDFNTGLLITVLVLVVRASMKIGEALQQIKSHGERLESLDAPDGRVSEIERYLWPRRHP